MFTNCPHHYLWSIPLTFFIFSVLYVCVHLKQIIRKIYRWYYAKKRKDLQEQELINYTYEDREYGSLETMDLEPNHANNHIAKSGELHEEIESVSHPDPTTSQLDSANDYVKIGLDAQNESLNILLSTKETGWYRISGPNEKDVIEVTEINNTKVYHLKAILDAAPEIVSYIIFDKVEEVNTWSPNMTMSCNILEKINANTIIAYLVFISAGTILKSRDFVVVNHRAKTHVFDKKSIVISSVSIDFHSALLDSLHKSSYVRGFSGPSCFVISPMLGNENKSEIRWILNSDLGGRIPKRLVEYAMQYLLVIYITSLRERISKT